MNSGTKSPSQNGGAFLEAGEGLKEKMILKNKYNGSGTTSSPQITASFIHNNWGGGAAFNTEDESWFALGVFGKEGRNNYERAKYIVPFLN